MTGWMREGGRPSIEQKDRKRERNGMGSTLGGGGGTCQRLLAVLPICSEFFLATDICPQSPVPTSKCEINTTMYARTTACLCVSDALRFSPIACHCHLPEKIYWLEGKE